MNRRVLASLIDWLVLLAFVVAVSVAADGLDPRFATARVVFVLVVFASYEPILNAFGCTMGQLSMGIRVRRYRDRSKRINLLQGYARLLFKILLGWYSFLTLTRSKERRAVHDMVSGSIMLEREHVDA